MVPNTRNPSVSITQEHGATRPRVVIVGAGFGGLAAVRRLRHVPVDVLLLNQTNYHLFTPLLYQVATAGLEADAIAQPVRALLRRQPHAAFRVTTVDRIDLNAKQLITDDGTVPYDFLIIAAGSRTNFFGLSGDAAHEIKELPHAIALRNHLLTQCEHAVWESDQEARRALLTFVVVGGGPTGVEMAGALRELVHYVIARDVPSLDLAETRVVLLEAGDVVLTPFRPKLQRKALRSLERMGIEVRLGAKVTAADVGGVELAGGERINARTLIWAAGVSAGTLAAGVSSAKGRAGRLVVDRYLRLSDHPEVFVIGDIAAFDQDGQTLPMLAPVAMQQGAHAADGIARLLRGEALRPFRYHDRGIMATIGRRSAVAQLGRFAFSGTPAWVIWLFVHLMSLVGYRNRILVLVNWAWDYFRYDRAVRLITSLPRATERPEAHS